MDETSRDQNDLTQEQRALLALRRMRSKIEALEREKTEPLAIVGMACRFPGAVDPEAFWQTMRAGQDSVSRVPPDRWDADALYDPNPDVPGKSYVREAAFIEDIDKFDARFFGISPIEAEGLDPQQRLLLEVSWEALENAGYAPERLMGSKVGVYVGVMNNDYQQILGRGSDLTAISAFRPPAPGFGMAVGRLSYILGIQGPSMPIDTACSSSFVAIHLACRSLRSKECHMALAGGVNLMLTPEMTVFMSKIQALGRDGRCKTFAAEADGYGRGEGCGIVVLKRVHDAISDGDNIRAVIRGTAVNHDGRSSALTAPNGPAQETVIRTALADGGADAGHVGYLEAHGTGTILGDPIELRALGGVFGKERPGDGRLAIGSAKTNVGHLESAAGTVGLIKAVLALQHEEIPPHLHLREINPHISLEQLPLVVPTICTPWLSGDAPRIAGVSSFGLGGTNSHVVLEEAPARKPVEIEVERPEHILCLSARSHEALKALAQRYERHLEAHAAESLANVCFTANTGRSHFEHRLAVVADSVELARERLAGFVRGDEVRGLVSGQMDRRKRPKVGFLFTGLGSQYAGMGRQLYESQPTFRRALDRCAAALEGLDVPLLEVLSGEGSTLWAPGRAEAALFAVEYSLWELYQTWGIHPHAVMGHGVGEYVAACAAGAFSVEDGLKLVTAQGRLQEGLFEGSAMVVVLADEAAVARAISVRGNGAAITAIHGPQNVVLVGPSSSVEGVVEELGGEAVVARRLPARRAAHSPLVEPMRDAFDRVVREVDLQQPRSKLVSCSTGGEVRREVCEPGHWTRHAREPVRFWQGMMALRNAGCEAFLEVGPGPVLLGLARNCLPGLSGIWVSSLRRGEESQAVLAGLGALYASGVEIDWVGFDRDYPRRRVTVPTYPFQRQRFWYEAMPLGQRVEKQEEPVNPLVGRHLVHSALDIFETRLSSGSIAFLNDYQVHGLTMVSVSSLLAMVVDAATSAFGSRELSIDELQMHTEVFLSKEAERTVQVILRPQAGSVSFEIINGPGARRQPGRWITNASGKINLEVSSGGEVEDALAAARECCDREVSVESLYQNYGYAGLRYGGSYRGIRQLWAGEMEAVGLIGLPQGAAAEAGRYQIHPVLLDACLQVLGLPLLENDATAGSLYLVGDVDRFEIHGRSGDQPLWCHASLRSLGDSAEESVWGDLQLFDDAGKVVAVVAGIELRRRSYDAIFQSFEGTSIEEKTTQDDRPEFLRQLEQARVSERYGMLASYVSGEIVKLLGLDPSILLDTTASLIGMGLDSLLGAELRVRVETALGLEKPLPAEAVFANENVDEIVHYLARDVLSVELGSAEEEDVS